jgi:hypothetical protein
MATPDPQLVTLFTTTGAALLMAYAGVRKNGLEWRRARRRCPACGRQLRDRTCGCAD